MAAALVAVAIALAAPVAVADPPVFDPALQNISVTITSGSGASVSFTPTSPGATVSCDPASGSTFPIGTTTVTCTATNGTDPPVDGSFTVTVTLDADTTPPVVSVPGNISTTTTNPSGTSVSFSASANDNVDGSIPASCSPGSGANFSVGSTNVTCTATDAHGNKGSASFSVTVTLEDSTPPVVTVPGPISTTTTNPSGKSVSFSASASDNIDGSIPASCSPGSGANFPVGSTNVTCTATDAHGNKGSASFSVTVTLVDTTPPVVTAPGDITREATGSGGAAVNFSATANDNLDGSIQANCLPSSGSTFPFGATTVTCSATDAHGNTGSDSFKITIRDTTKPVVSAPGDISTTTTATSGKSVTYSASASDNIDGSIPASCSPGSGANFPVGTSTVNCSATDNHGNTGTDSFKVTVTLVDTTKPVVSAPADINTTTTVASGKSVTFSASATDNLDGPITPSCSPGSGANFPVGATTVTCSATDTHGNTGSDSFKITITLVDTTPPVIAVPGDISTTTTVGSGTSVTFSASASDNLDGPIAASCSPGSGANFPVGTTNVTCTATDAHGNKGSASFKVTVTLVDTTAPVVKAPGDINTTTTVASGKSVTFSASATDNIDGSRPVTCSPASGANFPVGATTVTCTATDTHGNTGTDSFKVTVTLVDTTKPVVKAPADITREATGSGGAAVTFSATASDNIDGTLTPACSPPSGSTFGLGATTVTCSATDQHGNTGSDTFKITIRDTTDPAVHVPSNITVEAASPDGASASFSASADDNIDGPLSAACTPASGSTFRVGTTTVTCTATDKSGNKASATFQVTVGDTAGPTVTVPADLTREANGPAGAIVTFTASASDAVDGPLLPAAIACVPASGSTFPLGKTAVTCTASDSHGNTGHSSFAVTVVDTTPPRLNVPTSITMTSSSPLPASDATIAAFLAAANATDLVDGKVPVTNDAPASFPVGTTTVKFTATDKTGHKTLASSSITLTVANVPPPAPPNAQPPAQVGKLAARASDGAVTVTWVPPSDSDFDHVVVEQSSEGSPLAAVYTGSAKTYTAKGLKNGVEYRFVVVSYDKAGNASSEAAVVATPAVAMLVKPKDGALAKTPPVLDWRDVPGASYYNVQLYRVPSVLKATSALKAGSKVLSVWPATSSLKLSTKWVFSKKNYKFAPGTYRWFVWAGFGPRAEAKYGPLLGQSTFIVRAK